VGGALHQRLHPHQADPGAGPPTELDTFKEVFSGGTLKGNICFAVPTATLNSLVLYVDAGMFNSQRVFFTLT